jgi:hypothetical protein
MNIDAALLALSFISFLALLVTWIVAPRSSAPEMLPVMDSAPSAAIAA